MHRAASHLRTNRGMSCCGARKILRALMCTIQSGQTGSSTSTTAPKQNQCPRKHDNMKLDFPEPVFPSENGKKIRRTVNGKKICESKVEGRRLSTFFFIPELIPPFSLSHFPFPLYPFFPRLSLQPASLPQNFRVG